MTPSRAWFVVHPAGIVIRRERDRIALPTDEDAAALGLAEAETHELGLLDGEARSFAPEGARAVAASAPASGAAITAPFEVARLRDLYPVLGDAGFLMAGRATQIIEWATTHRFCGRCAAPTVRVPHERCMRCPACEFLGYPRIAPAVIALVRRGDEALLARGARFPGVFYSALAGFVEIGESLEQTIAREVREEVGVEVKDIRYFGSQAWPFPHSLMVGFFAEWAAGELRADGTEILDARWCRANDLPPIPPRLSIARALIDAWLEDVRRGDPSA